MEFKGRVLELRKNNKLTQEQLAKKVSVSKQTISKWELGKCKPGIEKLKKLSKVFNVNIEVLFY